MKTKTKRRKRNAAPKKRGEAQIFDLHQINNCDPRLGRKGRIALSPNKFFMGSLIYIDPEENIVLADGAGKCIKSNLNFVTFMPTVFYPDVNQY